MDVPSNRLGPDATEQFCAALATPEQQENARDWERLFEVLCAAWQGSHTCWPDLVLEPSVYLRYLAIRIKPPALPSACLSRLHSSDLYLACACVQGNATAINAFDQMFSPELQRALQSQRIAATVIDEVQQRLRTSLLLEGADGQAPRLERYSGQGRLFSWLRVVALRDAKEVVRPRQRQVSVEDAMAGVSSMDDDPELSFLKATYRQEFSEAFGAALQALNTEERNILRHHHLEGLSVDQLAVLYGIHRATAARRVAKIRASLLETTRSSLMARLRIDTEELDSIMRLIDSQLDVSLQRKLA